MSLVLRLVGRDADPARSKEHVLLAVLAERRLRSGQTADLTALLEDLSKPPIARIGALPVDSFLPKADRRALAAALNALLASPTFASWREGAALDIGAWLAPRPDGKTPAVVVSVAHLDDEERMLVLGVLFEEILSWVRSLPGSQRLRALVAFDEMYGFLPAHPANPPTKRPIVSLMKQARAFGVGILLATQNPMDIDYRALGNAGLWCVGRLQTDADRERVVDGLALNAHRNDEMSAKAIHTVLKKLAPRWFVVRSIYNGTPQLLQPRWAMSLMRGPMTRKELTDALKARGAPHGGTLSQGPMSWLELSRPASRAARCAEVVQEGKPLTPGTENELTTLAVEIRCAGDNGSAGIEPAPVTLPARTTTALAHTFPSARSRRT